MAGLRGYDGKIVIDENEANKDIKNIEQAVEKLERARELLSPSKIDDARMTGKMRYSLDSQLNKICSDLTVIERLCLKTNHFINKTVEKYKKIDEEVAKQIRG